MVENSVLNPSNTAVRQRNVRVFVLCSFLIPTVTFLCFHLPLFKPCIKNHMVMGHMHKNPEVLDIVIIVFVRITKYRQN